MSATDALCPCCASPAPQAAVTPGDYRSCPCCGHRWRQAGRIDAAHYQSLSARNDADTPWFKRKMGSRQALIQPLVGEIGAQRILEVGCAEGELGRRIKAGLTLRYDGIELSRDAVQAGQVLDQVFTTPAAGIPPASYDLIASFHVLEHIADVGAELASWTNLLSENGLIIVEVPNRAGHPWLESDLNPEHLHQFTPVSLSLLLARHGWDCTSLSTGHYESPVYPDSIRAIARLAKPTGWGRQKLIERFRLVTGGPFFVYGIGGDFKNYIEPLLDDLDVRALLDSAPDKWGQSIGQHAIGGYDAERHAALPIVISSIKFGRNIKTQLLAQGIAAQRLIGLEEIYASA